RRPPSSPLFRYTTLFRSQQLAAEGPGVERHGKTDRGVELVHLSVGIHPEVILGHATGAEKTGFSVVPRLGVDLQPLPSPFSPGRSEEHTSELQSRSDLVC